MLAVGVVIAIFLVHLQILHAAALQEKVYRTEEMCGGALKILLHVAGDPKLIVDQEIRGT